MWRGHKVGESNRIKLGKNVVGAPETRRNCHNFLSFLPLLFYSQPAPQPVRHLTVSLYPMFRRCLMRGKM